MNFSERVKAVRKASGLNQTAFAESLGLTRDSYANFEYDRIKSETAKNPTILAICNTYRVNEEWLRTGDGEMYIKPTREQALVDLVLKDRDINDPFYHELVKMLSQMNASQIATLKDMVKKLSNAIEE